VVLFDLEKLIRQELDAAKWDCTVNDGFPEEHSYIRELKKDQKFTFLSSFKDSPRYQDILSTVPCSERPPILLEFYGDAADRDLMGHTSRNNVIHFTYVRVLNVHDGCKRGRDQYRVVQLTNKASQTALGYSRTLQMTTSRLRDLVERGIMYNERKHAVRLARLQGDALERNAQFGLAENFSRMAFFDVFSYATTSERIAVQSSHDIVDQTSRKRTRESYQDDLSKINGSKITGESDLKRSRGMQNDSVWNTVDHYHVTQPGAMTTCSSHDLFNGAARGAMSSIIKALAVEKYIEWEDLVHKINLVQSKTFKGTDKVNWRKFPDKFDQFKKVPGNHASNHNLIRNFNLFFVGYPREPPDEHAVSKCLLMHFCTCCVLLQ